MKEKVLEVISKNKKILIIVGVVLVILAGCSIMKRGNNNETWDRFLLNEHLPKPKKGTIDEGSNLDDYLSFSIKGVKNKYYQKYKDACIEMGYTIESEESGNRYEAYNKEGYELSLSYISDNIWIILQAPEDMSEISWPTSGIGSMLPAPSSNLGKIESNTSNSFKILVGNTSLEDYSNYVNACESSGFNVDFSKQDDHFYAKNSEGYRLSLSYTGNNIMSVLIEVPKSDSSDESQSSNNSSSNNSSNQSTPSSNSGEIRKEFKDAMDSYEKFMDEYVAFMKKYSASNGTDMSLLSDYTKFLQRYSEFSSDFDKWESSDMNTKEAAYYLEVQTRVTQKLLEIAG